MPIWLDVLLNIVQATVPALIVFFTVLYLQKQYNEQRLRLKQLELRQGNSASLVPLRLQAYERLTLLCERIKLPALMLRIRSGQPSGGELHAALMLAIQQEFDHNATQQVYISGELWQILQIAKSEAAGLLTQAQRETGKAGQAQDYAQAVFRVLNEQGQIALDKALEAIRTEASALYR